MKGGRGDTPPLGGGDHFLRKGDIPPFVGKEDKDVYIKKKLEKKILTKHFNIYN